jgi:MFS superfamily sulfate permease-like transporter
MLIVMTIVVIGLFIAVLAGFLLAIGVLLNNIADNLDDSLENVKTIVKHAEVIIPEVEHINRTGGVVAGALPLLYGGAERIAAKVAPPTPAPVNGHTNVPAAGRRRSRLMDTVGFRDARH